jgi:UDP-3-O-[3-hydroxymyristoyl] N-acetylglucosamine deacetylase/3-hydroxyacyl-[acyl-carrier-protein] dehydratase
MGSQPRQTTLARPVSKEGIGLHTGAVSALTLLPAAPDAGIVFGCPSGEEVPALADHVTSTARATTLGRGGAQADWASTTCGSNSRRRAADKRVMGGWIRQAACSGPAPRRRGRCEAAGRARRTLALALPASRFTLAVGIDFMTRWSGRQDSGSVTPGAVRGNWRRRVRVQHEVEALLTAGLAKGGNEENAVVGPPGYSCAFGRRCGDKAADAVGDLALCGSAWRRRWCWCGRATGCV